jgi:hypothetical protein
MAPSNALTVEEIINGFPNPTLPKIDHEPTFEDIQVTTRLFNANAISMPSMAGDGAHGHLGIIMTQGEYATISTSPRVGPYNPNAVPSYHQAPLPLMPHKLCECTQSAAASTQTASM